MKGEREGRRRVKEYYEEMDGWIDRREEERRGSEKKRWRKVRKRRRD